MQRLDEKKGSDSEVDGPESQSEAGERDAVVWDRLGVLVMDSDGDLG